MTRASRGGRPIRQDSVRSRMERYFVDNDDEELTYADAREKFQCSQSAIENAVTALRKAGTIESVHVIRNRKKGIAR